MLLLKNIIYRRQHPTGGFEINIPELGFKTGIVNAILGKNGSGKTTILHLIGGHIACDRGSIYLFDEDITRKSAIDRSTASVFQTISLFPHLTVKENIQLAIEPNAFFGVRKETQAYAGQIMSDFDLVQYSDRKPSQLSIGQQQRVAIARALATNPSVLLLDEPTSALDFSNISYLKTLLLELNQKQVVPICIIVSHDLAFVSSIADEIKYVEEGRVVFEGDNASFSKSSYNIHL